MILLGDAAVVLKDFKDGCIDLTVTSPPYDDLRTYGVKSKFTFDFETVANELYRVTKDRGVVVWIVGDATNEGTETLSSFKQAIYFRQLGFKLHDTMIYAKTGFSKPSVNRYHQTFEYMFVFAKTSPKCFNPIKDKMNTKAGRIDIRRFRQPDGSFERQPKQWQVQNFGMRYNVWFYDSGNNNTTDNMDQKHTTNHPAVMSEELAEDHIKSWSHEGDLILDPFAGSGTTLKAAHLLRRKWIGIEINPDYVSLIKKRLTPYVQQQRLEEFIK